MYKGTETLSERKSEKLEDSTGGLKLSTHSQRQHELVTMDGPHECVAQMTAGRKLVVQKSSSFGLFLALSTIVSFAVPPLVDSVRPYCTV
jgi:hypothetical protein